MLSVKSMIVLASLLALLSASVRADEARSIVERAIETHGGTERIARTKIGRLQANVECTFVGSGGMKVTWQETFDLPNRYRRAIEGIQGGQPFHMELTVNRGEGWMRQGEGPLQVFPVPQTLPLEQHWHAVLAQLVVLKDKDTRLTVLGEERRDGRALAGIRAASPRGEAVLFFDKSTGLLARARRPLANVVTGQQMLGETAYDEYKDIGGVRYPMHMKASNGDTYLLNIALSSIEFLDEIDPRVFAKPSIASPRKSNVPPGKLDEKNGEDETVPTGGPNVETPARWNVRLIVATLSGGVVIGLVWFIVRVSRRRSQETPQI